jgi:hypothetical protein
VISSITCACGLMRWHRCRRRRGGSTSRPCYASRGTRRGAADCGECG